MGYGCLYDGDHGTYLYGFDLKLVSSRWFIDIGHR